MKTGMTREEKNWVLYDVGNSAFVLLVATIMPIYFNYLAENAGLSAADYLAYCSLRPPAVANAFHSGHSAEQNGRPYLIN